MRFVVALLPTILYTAGAAAGLVHDHHHLISQEFVGDSRNGFLEVDEHTRSVSSSVTKAPGACSLIQNPQAEAILEGTQKAAAFGGISEDCGDGYGCQSEYWGRWCRFNHNHAPQCPAEVQEDLQSRLRGAAEGGHQWARDILLVRPCQLFPYLEGRTLWIIGDSMSKDFAFAFQCFMLEFWDREDSGRWPKNPSMSPNVSDDPTIMQDLLTELGKIEPNQEAEPWYLQWCVPMYGGTRMCFLRANTGSFVAKNLMPLLPRLASKHDIVLLNFGLHSNDNGSLWGYIQELEAFGEQYEQHKQQMPQFLWRQTSVQHFDTPIGEWVPDKPQQEQRCVPIKGVELREDGSLGDVGNSSLWSERASDMTNAMDTLLRGGRRNVRSEYVMAKLGVPIMHIWNQTVPFWDFHRYYHDPEDGTACAKVACDCTHICVPSWHQMWMASLQQSLALIGKKGGSKFEHWGTPIRHPIPGVNVPLKYYPHLHNISATPEGPGQISR